MTERLLGEAISVATGLGMHAASPPESTSFLVELRRRLFAHICVVDKSSSIFTGRPPRLSHRYCAASLPLDVSDEVVMALPGHLIPTDSVAPGKINESGWNTEGALYKTTITRARTLISYVRDEILELALGVNQVLDTSHLRCVIKGPG